MDKRYILIVILFIGLFVISACKQTVGENINNINQQNINNENINLKEFENIKLNKFYNIKTETYDENILINVNKANDNYKIDALSINNDMSAFDKSKGYKIKNFIDNKGNVKTELSYNNELVQIAPQRDRPREGDEGINPNIREYFDVNIIVDDENIWVENEGNGIYVVIYYRNMNLIDSLLYEGQFSGENIRVYTDTNAYGEQTNINTNNYDVILALTGYDYSEEGNVEMIHNLIMVQPIRDRENEITFDLRNAELVNTNLDEFNQEQGTNKMSYELFGISPLFNAGYDGFDFSRVNNKIYVREDAIKEDWTFSEGRISSFPDNEIYDRRLANYFIILIDNIVYPLQGSYDFDENDLNQVRLRLKNPFNLNFEYNEGYNYFRLFAYNDPLGALPISANIFFTSNINEKAYTYLVFYTYFTPITDYIEVYSLIPFYEYNQNYGDQVLEVFKKPSTLKLYIPEEFPNVLVGYPSNGNNLDRIEDLSFYYFYPSNDVSVPLDYISIGGIRFFNIEDLVKFRKGNVRVITPNGNRHSSLQSGGSFLIRCYNEIISERDVYFPRMECVEGDYIINWSFTNIIKDRDIYLDAVVHYDGERWNILQQNPRMVNRQIRRRPARED